VQGAIGRAEERVDHANWSFDLVGAIPILGRPVHAAERLVDAASIELGSIDLARRTVADMTGQDGSPPMMHGGRVDLEQLARAEDAVTKILADLARVREKVASVRPIPFARQATTLKVEALGELDRVRARAENIARGLRVLPQFFGAKGLRLYLLAILNPAELHGVGGAFLSYGIVTADRGALSLVAAGDPLELDPRAGPGTGVPPPKDNYFLNHIYPVRLVNAFTGPDFAEGARLASSIVKARFRRPLDGVIAVDAVGLSHLLPSLGSIDFPRIKVHLNAKDFVRFSTNAQYRLYSYDVRQSIQRATIAQVWSRIGSPSDPFGLLSGLSRALAEKRVLLWSRFPAEQGLFEDNVWAGRLRPVLGDYLFVEQQNLGVDKLDYYLAETISYRAEIFPSGAVGATASIRLLNRAPPNLPQPTGNNAGSQMRTLIGPLVPPGTRFDPPAIVLDDLSDGAALRVAQLSRGYGKRMFVVVLKLNAGRPGTATFRYAVPHAVVRFDGGQAYHLTVQYQPPVHPATLNLEIIPPPGKAFGILPPGWALAGRSAVFSGPLTRDLDITLPLVPLG